MKSISYAAALRLLLASSSAVASFTDEFESPPAAARPKFRYWFADASISESVLGDDIKAIGRVGAGGLQLLGFYNYGLGPALTDWNEYGFGLPAYKDVLRAALERCDEEGLLLDYAIGPNQGQGVPSETETDGLARELVYQNVTVAGGETFSGPLPGPVVDFNNIPGFMNPNELWGENKFLAAVAVRLTARLPVAGYFSVGILEQDSAIDLTAQVKEDALHWTAPSGNSTWELFFVYERFTQQRACAAGADPVTPIQNGSWTADHFSVAGARKAADFWDERLLKDEAMADLLEKTAQSSWEDSMEMQAALWWTPGLAERFEQHHNYSLVTSLPVLFHAANAWGGFMPPYNTTYTFGTYAPTAVHEDYWYTLTQLYKEYVGELQAWAEGKGLTHSCQPAYNLPLDMSASIPLVGVPELESLGFAESVDLYRQFTGAAHMSGRKLISTEVGAVNVGGYTQTIPSLLDLMVQSLAAGVNRMVIHGFPYSGDYPNTTWPGYTPFNYEYTDMWSPHQPGWDHMNDSMMFTARNSHVLQSGTPKVDLAFYYHAVPWNHGREIYPGQDLNRAGYTHEYVGVENLASPQAIVSNGVLAEDGPAYRALVIYNQTKISPDASAKLVEMAQAGLPVLIFGSPPNSTIGANGQAQVSQNMQLLMHSSNTHVYPLEDLVADALSQFEIQPRVQVVAGDDASYLYTLWMEDESSGDMLVFMNNRGDGGTFTLAFESQQGQVPSMLDAWTGKQHNLRVYSQKDGLTMIDVTLRTSQSRIVRLSADTSGEGDVHVTSVSANVYTVRQDEDGRDRVVLKDDMEASLGLSTGKTVSIPAGQKLEPLHIMSWNLTFFSYAPGDDMSSVKSAITEIDVGRLDVLTPWTNISQIAHLSGTSRYMSNFTMSGCYSNSNSSSMLATLSLGPVLHTMRVWVNGELAPAVDVFDPVVDITALVRPGDNQVEVEVSGTLFNAVKARIGDITSAAGGINDPTKYEGADWHPFGLIGPVKVEVYRQITMDLSSADQWEVGSASGINI